MKSPLQEIRTSQILNRIAGINVVGKIPPAFKIIFTAFTEFVLDKPVSLTIKGLKHGGNTTGSIDLVNFNAGKFVVKFKWPAIPMYSLKTLAHELTHVNQFISGKLDYNMYSITIEGQSQDTAMITWKGKPYISVSDYNKLKYDEHGKLPWEAEANKVGKSKPQEFVSSLLPKLKGIDPTLDYIIDEGYF